MTADRTRQAVIDRLAAAYFHAPYIARQKVDGVAEWSSDYTSSQIAQWASEADTMAYARECLRLDGRATPKEQTKELELYAARDALFTLAQDAEAREREAWDAYEDRPHHRMPRYA